MSQRKKQQKMKKTDIKTKKKHFNSKLLKFVIILEHLKILSQTENKHHHGCKLEQHITIITN